MSEPFVPGSFTYSNLGAGADVAVGVAKLLLPSVASEKRGDAGWSSERRPKTFVIIRGRKRGPVIESGCDLVDAARPGAVKMSPS